MATSNIELGFKFKWWFKYFYLPMLVIFCVVFDKEPKSDNLDYWIKKGIKFYIGGKRIK